MTQGIVWDMQTYFPGFDSKERVEFKEAIINEIETQKNIAADLQPVNSNNLEQWEKFIIRNENLTKNISHYFSYISCLSAAHANDEKIKKENAALDSISASLDKVQIAIQMGFKDATDEDFSRLLAQPGLKGAEFALTKMRIHAQKTMNAELEGLASDLGVDGFSAWERLYNTISGKMTFEMEWPDGKKETLPIAQCRSVIQDPDRNVRKKAFEQGNKSWEGIEDVCAQALNSIAGTRLLLNKRRGYDHFLDVSLEQSKISRKTLDAMLSAIDECLDFSRDIIKAKAKAMKLNALSWYDFEAPLPIPDLKRYSWEEGVKIVQDAFDRSYPKFGEFLKATINKGWVESEPRKGKMPGAFCTGSYFIDESRVFMTYSGSLGDVSTLAHEVGHAFHSFLMKGMRPLSRMYPMTLAESASTFGEIILADGILSDPTSTDAEKLNILTQALLHATAFTIDIPIRFKFEKKFHEERMKGEVSVSRLKEIMTETMHEQFGDSLEKDGANPYFWASKMHFYITGVTFYNYPYSFGYLLSRGLYQMFRDQKEAFLPKYEQFLKYSGSDMAHEVAKKTIEADLEDTKFWKDAIMSHEPELKMFNELAQKVLK